MNAAAERRRADLTRLEELCARSSGRLRVLGCSGTPLRELKVELRCRTAPSSDYPARLAEQTQVRIQLPGRYPFEPPLAEVLTPIFHPNVYPSGRICLGVKWLPTEGLDLLVLRIAQIVTFDPALVNVNSPANRDAAVWYQRVSASRPRAFPTDSLSFLNGNGAPRSSTWRDLSGPSPAPGAASPMSQLVLCPSCKTWNRLGTRANRPRCGKCGEALAA